MKLGGKLQMPQLGEKHSQGSNPDKVAQNGHLPKGKMPHIAVMSELPTYAPFADVYVELGCLPSLGPFQVGKAQNGMVSPILTFST